MTTWLMMSSHRVWPAIGGFTRGNDLIFARSLHANEGIYIAHAHMQRSDSLIWNSFCRKTTLTKHQHRSHPPGTMTRPPSEDTTVSEQSYQAPVSVSISNDQYLLAQQPYYPQPATPSHEFYPQQQNLPVTQVIPEPPPPPLVTQNLPVSPPLEIQQMQQQVQQQYLQQLMQQQNRTGYLPPEFHQPSFTGQPMPETNPLMMSYLPNYQYKPPTRILNQPEGTDWAFLGVG